MMLPGLERALHEEMLRGYVAEIGGNDHLVIAQDEVLELMARAAARARQIEVETPKRKKKEKKTRPVDNTPVIVRIRCARDQVFDLHQSLVDELQLGCPLTDASAVIREGVMFLNTQLERKYTAVGMPQFWRHQFMMAQRRAEKTMNYAAGLHPPKPGAPPSGGTRPAGQDNKRFTVPNHEQTQRNMQEWRREQEDRKSSPSKPAKAAGILKTLLAKGNGDGSAT